MRICLFSGIGSGGALDPMVVTEKLAHELTALGHSVHVIASDANVPFAPEANILSQDNQFTKASPRAHRAFCLAVSQWDKFNELHSLEPFDVLDTGSTILSGLMPSMCRTVPVVCSVHEDMAMFKEPVSPLEPLDFDCQLVAMLERLTLTLVQRISLPSEQLARQLQRKLKVAAQKIDVFDDMTPAANSKKIAQYQAAIESSKICRASGVYLKPPTCLSSDALDLFRAYDEMIYNFLYQNSWRFRLHHWWQMLKSNPGLFQVKLKKLLNRLT